MKQYKQILIVFLFLILIPLVTSVPIQPRQIGWDTKYNYTFNGTVSAVDGIIGVIDNCSGLNSCNNIIYYNNNTWVRSNFYGSSNISITDGIITVNASIGNDGNTNCSVTGSCQSIAYLDYANMGNLNISGIVSANYINSLYYGNRTNYYTVDEFLNKTAPTDIVSWVGNWSKDKADYYTSSQTDTEIENANTSMAIYVNSTFITIVEESNLNVNSSDYWDNLSTTSDINAGDITDDGTYVKITGDTMTGNLGIKMSPSYELDTNGTIRALNNIIVGNNTGAAGFTGLGDLYALGNIKVMEGVFVESQAYGAGLEISDNDLAVTYTNILSANATLNATSQILYDSEASFDASYEEQFLRIITSAGISFSGATGEITDVIDSTHIVLSFVTAGTDVIPDATEASYIIYPAPTLFAGDNGVVNINIGDNPDAEFGIHIHNGTGFTGIFIHDTAGADQHQALTINQDIKNYDGIVGFNLFTDSSDGVKGITYAQLKQEIGLGGINNSNIQFMSFNTVGQGSDNDVDIIHIIGNNIDNIILQGSEDILTNAYVENVDQTINFTTTGAGATLFENNNEYVYVGAPVNFTTTSFELSTPSNKNLLLEYYYCNSSEGYEVLPGVTDTTDGMTQSGSIVFINPSDRGTCNTDFDGTPFTNTTKVAYIAIKRTLASVQIEPIESLVTVGGSETLMLLRKDMLKLDGSNGGPVVCSSSYAGAWYYDKTSIQLLWCDGTSWVVFASGAAAVTVHNSLTGLQGGISAEYYHLSSAQHTIATQAATTSVSGYLTTTDWDTFNDKASTAYVDAANAGAWKLANFTSAFSSKLTDNLKFTGKVNMTDTLDVTNNITLANSAGIWYNGSGICIGRC